MAHLSCSDDNLNKSDNSTHDGVWSEEHDCIPLKQRLKLLLASKRLPILSDNNFRKERTITIVPPVDIVVKREDQNCDSQGRHSACSAGDRRNEGFSLEESHAGILVEYGSQGTQVNEYIRSNQISTSKVHADTVRVEKVNASTNSTNLLQGSLPSEYPVKIKVECTDDVLMSSSGNGLTSGADSQEITINTKVPDDFEDDLDHVILKVRRRMLLSRKSFGLTKPVMEGCSSWLSNPVEEDSSLHSYSPSTTLLDVKAEPLDIDDLNSLNKNAGDRNSPFTNRVSVKTEVETLDMCHGDEVDHMLLRERIKLLASREVPNCDISRNFKCLGKIQRSVVDYCSPVASESTKTSRINRPRKRRKTATDSVETALEEDAPGLLEVLIGKGVLLDEIKLYGERESDEALDDSLSDDSFAELEDVISKLFFQRHSLLKLAPLRCSKGEKANYCLACLVSLIEQARYLKFRKWPVEWGWCRDLQSFIFVFERHNRIVLERPEYGYATYFFELVDFLPVDWQIKRLVTSMKLPKCSRVTLIENKALVVGEDLSEGEARVLMDYGWIPNSGLGTMLNYCDRVVHDRKNESDNGSEWRSKIGKLLVHGYNCGTIVSTDIPKKVVEYSAAQSPQIKLEL